MAVKFSSRPRRPRSVGRRLKPRIQILANRLAVQAGLARDRADRQALSPQIVNHDDQPQFDHRTITSVGLRPGGDFDRARFRGACPPGTENRIFKLGTFTSALLGIFQPALTQRAGQGGKQQPVLVRPPRVATRAVGEQVELLFLDPVPHVAAGAIHPVVQPLRRTLQAGDDIARVRAAPGILGLDDHPPEPSTPGLGGVGERVEHAHLLAARLVHQGRQFQDGLRLPGRRYATSSRSPQNMYRGRKQ